MHYISLKKTVSVLLFLLAAGLPLSMTACSQQSVEDGRIGVAVTIVPQAEFVERVGGDKVDIIILVPPGASPHTYELTPSQVARLSEAGLYVKVGSGVEFELVWMDKIIAQNKDMTVVDCSKGIPLEESVSPDEHEDEEEPGSDEDHHATDPHIWMAPKNVMKMVSTITEGLIQADPDNRTYYEENRNTYLAELEQLDLDIRNSLAGVTNRVFMVYHPSFGYFASTYDLTMLPVEDEGKEPTPAGLQHLIEQAREHDIRVVFASPQFNPESANVIADAIDGRVVLIDPLDRDYSNNMRMLMEELTQAME